MAMALEVITTVVTAAASHDLVTLGAVKDELELKDSGSDAQLKRYITSASAAAGQYCNRVFQVETIKDEFWPQREAGSRLVGGRLPNLQLSRFPVTAVASLTEDGTALVDGTDFRIDYQHGLLIRLNSDQYPTPWTPLPIVVQYSAGYATVPTDVADAVVRMVRARWFAKGRDPFLMSENIPGVYESRYWIATGNEAGNLPPDVEDILDNYRVPLTL